MHSLMTNNTIIYQSLNFKPEIVRNEDDISRHIYCCLPLFHRDDSRCLAYYLSWLLAKIHLAHDHTVTITLALSCQVHIKINHPLNWVQMIIVLKWKCLLPVCENKLICSGKWRAWRHCERQARHVLGQWNSWSFCVWIMRVCVCVCACVRAWVRLCMPELCRKNEMKPQ